MQTHRWMTHLEETIRDTPLRELALPASHDTGTYELQTPWSADGVDSVEDFFAPDLKADDRKIYLVKDIAEGWAKAQGRSVYRQLNDGIRYLDLRVAVDPSGSLRAVHSFYGPTYEAMLSEVQRFCDENPSEVVILGFNHFWDVDFLQESHSRKPGKDEGMTDEHWKKLSDLIEGTLGDRLICPSRFDANSTLRDLWEDTELATGHRNQVVAIFAKDNGQPPAWAWRFAEANTWRGEIINKGKYKADLKETLRAASDGDYDGKFWAIRSSLTPTAELYGKGVDSTGTYPGSLKALAKDTNPVVFGWIRDKWAHKKINLIWSDFYHRHDQVALALWLNGADVDLSETSIGRKTNWGNWKMGWELALEWCEAQGMKVVNWAKGAGATAVEVGEEIGEWLGIEGNEKAEPPNNGTRPEKLDRRLGHLIVELESIRVKNAGSEDVWPDDPDLELYGTIAVVPINAIMNRRANLYLWNKSQDQEVKIDEGKTKRYSTKKDIYFVKDTEQRSMLKLQVAMREEDTGNDDKLSGESLVDVAKTWARLGKHGTATRTIEVRSGSQKVELKFKIRRGRFVNAKKMKKQIKGVLDSVGGARFPAL